MPAGRTGMKLRALGGAVDPCFKRRVDFPSSSDCHQAAGLLGWWQSSDLVLADGANVSTWTNKDGSGNNASRATVSEQPIFVKNPFGAGAPSVRFDTASKGLDISGLAGTPIQAFTCHVVCRGDLTQQGFNPVLSASSLNGGFVVEPDSSTDLEQAHIEGNPNPPFVTFAATCKPHVLSFVADPVGGTERLFRNGSLVSNSAYTARPAQAFNTWVIGSTHLFSIGWIGDVWEIMLHSVAQSDATVLSVGTCLASKYNLP